MENTLNRQTVYEAPDLHPVVEESYSDGAEGVAARGDPTTDNRSDGRPPGRRAMGYAVIGLVLVVLGAMLLITQGRLGDAREEIAALDRVIAATEAAAADEARSAALDVAALEERVTRLVASLASAETDLDAATESLTEARSDSARLEDEIAGLEQEVEAAQGVVAAAHDDVAKLDALTALHLAWWSWGTPTDDVRGLETRGIDLEAIDGVIRELGLAEDWEAWAATNFFVAARIMGNYVDDVDDSAVTSAWDAWVGCTTMDACTKAAVEFDGVVVAAITDTMTSLRATAGASRADF